MSKGGLSRGIFGARPSDAPGQITDLTTPTASGTSFTAEFSVPDGTVTSYQYRIDGGTATPLGGGPGTEITDQVTGLAVDVEVRAMNGGTPGPWSDISVGDPGLNVNILFDNATYGYSGGSWATRPTGVVTTDGNKDWPNVGFTSDQARDDAELTCRAVISDLRRIINSKATVSMFFGMGRYPSKLTAGNFIWAGGGGGVIYNGAAQPTSNFGKRTLTYSEYRDLVALLPDADQRNAYGDPGAFPWGATMDISHWLYAVITNSTDSTVWFTVFAPENEWTFDWNGVDPTICGTGKLTGYRSVLHETTQDTSRYGITRWPNILCYKPSGGGIWKSTDGSVGQFNSHDQGATNLGLTLTTDEPFDWSSAAGAFSAVTPGTGNAGIPASPLSIPGGRTLPLRQEDGKYLFALYPATALTRSWAGF